MKKKFLTILLTVLVFLSATALGVATVFRVDSVTVEATVVSSGAQAEANQLKEDLENLYKHESIFSVKQEKADALLAEYPYFRLEGFAKTYPDKLLVKIVEDAEVYAVENGENGYYILSRNGSVLDIREDKNNRLDGNENVLLLGLTATGRKGGTLSGDACFPSVFTLCQKMDEVLGGIRRNVRSVEIFHRTPETVYRVSTYEGVKLYIDAPLSMTEEKAAKALEKYFALTDAERMTGRILVVDVDGQVSASYASVDEFQA